MRSKNPPHLGADGGLKLHWIFLDMENSLNFWKSMELYSAEDLIRLVPLSEKTVVGLPLRAINLLNAKRKLSVEREVTGSTWIAWNTAQVKRATQHILPFFKKRRPHKSVPMTSKTNASLSRSRRIRHFNRKSFKSFTLNTFLNYPFYCFSASDDPDLFP